MIKVLFFAQIREQVGVSELKVAAKYRTVEALRLSLCEQGKQWQQALEEGRVLVAVNQTISAPESEIHAGDEVAFFPPVTGG